MKQNLRLLIVLIIFGIGASNLQSQSVSVLLQQGIYAEETEGDLNAAIAIYNDIVNQTDLNRAIAAQALYRLGLCHLKLGNKTEAASVLNKLVNEYTEQESLVALAREQLGQPSSAVVSTQVWKDAMDAAGSVSSDGRYYAFTDWDTGNLAVRDLETGENLDLTRKANWEDSADFADAPVFSRDGEQIAFTWWRDGAYPGELRVVSLEDPEPRIVTSDFRWVTPHDWSPDGTQIVAVSSKRTDDNAELSLISIADGSVKTVKHLGNNKVFDVRFSPDGKHLAYDRLSESGRPEQDIFLINLITGEETALLKHPADEKVMEWGQENNLLLFSSNREGTRGLWSIRIEDGVSQGEPQLLKSGIGDATSLGLTRDGAIFYGVRLAGTGLYQASLDFDSGELQTDPREVPINTFDVSQMALSPDGRSIAYLVSLYRNTRQPKLLLFDLESSESRELFSFKNNQFTYPPVWSKDSRAIFQRIRDSREDQYAEQFLIDAQSGIGTPLAKDALGSDLMKGSSAAAFSEDSLLYVCGDIENKRIIAVKRDLETGSENEFVLVENPTTDALHSFAIRTDLNAVFYLAQPTDVSNENPATIYQYDLASGTMREILQRLQKDRPFHIYPAPNPSFLALTDIDRDNSPHHAEASYFVSLLDVSRDSPEELWTTELSAESLALTGTNSLGFPNDDSFTLLRWGGWTSNGGHLAITAQLQTLHAISSETGKIIRTGLTTIFGQRPLLSYHPNGKQVFYRAWRSRSSEVWRIDNLMSSLAPTE